MERPVKKANSSKKEREEQKRISERLQARRPLKTLLLEPPEYTIDTEHLLKDGSFYEKDVRVSR